MNKEVLENATTIKKMVSKMGELCRELETFVDSKELPIAEVEYQIAKDSMWETMKAEAMAVTEIKERLRGRIPKHVMRRKAAEIKYKSIQVRIGVLEKQLNGYQSINKYLDSV